MLVIRARNVNHAYVKGSQLLNSIGVKLDSRNGPVLEAPEPVSTIYMAPKERILWDEQRDANPFFHFFESLWMLAGRNDVAFPTQFVKRAGDYSDNGITLHSAYGYRWLGQWSDQLTTIVDMLRRDPLSRRCVLQMWHSELDLGTSSKDLPCNVMAHFQVRGGSLLMTVFNRSNDMIWGAYGANVVQFSMLQQYLAERIGVGVGPYTQVSNNFHGYVGEWQKKGLDQYSSLSEPTIWDPYSAGTVMSHFLGAWDEEPWDRASRNFFDWADAGTARPILMGHEFWDRVAVPLFMAHRAWKNTSTAEESLPYLDLCMASDWSLAGRRWIRRRAK